MHTRTIGSLLSSFVLAAGAARADGTALASRVDAVTVFPSAVTVHRVSRAAVAEGEHTLLVGPLPTALADDTVRIGGFGPGATVESVTVRAGRLAEFTAPEIARLAEQLAASERERVQLARRREETARQRGPTAELDRALAALAARVSAQSQALTQARAEGEREVKLVAVDVTTTHAGSLDLSVEYTVPGGASWRPSYAAHLDASGAHVALDVFAAVQQSTDEDWSNVRLSVASISPVAGLALPTFEEQAIELEPAEELDAEPALASRRHRLGPAAMGGRAGAAATAVAPAVEPPALRAPLEQRTAEAHANLLSARLDVPGAVSLRAGAAPRRLLAAHAELDCAIEYQAAPRQSSEVYLAARFRNANAFPLLAGNVALFLGADYVGTTALAAAPIDEEVLLPFGADAGVTIDRTLVRRALTTRAGRDETALHYRYRLSNHRARAATVTVFEQLPVSHSHGLAVRTVPGELALQPHHEGDAPGVVRWSARVEPGGTQRWDFGYVISAPRRRAVTGSVE